MPGLTELLSEDCIALDVPAATWEEAVLAAGGLLEQAGVAGPAYTGSMIDNVEANGPYIVVAPGFAFAHARPSPAVGILGGARVSERPAHTGRTSNLILTVCGNGLGTSLFLKNTLEQVLGTWGWAPFITVEATDTISAKGRAKDADLILTSGEIAKTLGDVGVPVRVIDNFTSTREIDAVLRDSYDV